MQQKQWYILSGENQKGPYDYKQMIELMQTGELFDYHYIWSPGMEGWTMLAEVPDFSRDRLALLIQTHGQGSEGFYRREHERVSVNLPFFAHNNESFFQGTCTNLSRNGALVTLNSPFVLPAQELTIHFSKSETLTDPFKIKALVIRKHASKQVLHIKAGLQYAIRFIQVQGFGETLIEQLIFSKNENQNNLSR